MSQNATQCSIHEYQCSDVGMLMPFVNEYTWPIAARGTLYFFGLIWIFMGVSILADIFMRSIETITSKTRPIRLPDPSSQNGYTDIEVKVWNDTVANLTLMALGSSAPEILLSFIEIVFKNGFKSGDLGPSTIVGSAAFNLLVITAVCIVSIPDAEKKIIKNVKVFAVTSIFSIFAYLWLLVILVAITPDYVDLWEAIVTLLFFPMLVVLAYIADKEYCSKKSKEDTKAFGIGEERKASKEFIVDILKKIGKRPDVSEEDEARIAAAWMASTESHDKGWYRMNAIRGLTGSSRLVPPVNDKQERMLSSLVRGEAIGSAVSLEPEYDTVGVIAVVEWAASSTAVLEKDGRVKVVIMRHGNLKNRVLVGVETIDGTATSHSDYKPIKETVVFNSNETSKEIEIEIIDDNEWEPDEVFFIKLAVEPEQAAKVGKRSVTQVTILNDDAPGKFEFAKPSFVFKESAGKAMIPVERTSGADGSVEVSWKTKDMTAINNRDYIGGSGKLIFQHGETTKYIEIEIVDDQNFEKDEHFEIQLKGVSVEGAEIGRLKRTVITIMNDDEFKGVVSRVVNLTNANLDALKVSTITWGQQFEEAMNVNGGDVENARPFDYIMHFLTFGFKVIFACIPPPSIWGGWLCFIVSIGVLGIVTSIVGDLASIFGCLVGLQDTVTAITFVALGTSVPDLFASKQAALQEPYADSSVGNVTGSNSVNVFLGLGLSWLSAAIYWTAKGQTFEVPAGNLSFSVILYTVCAVLCLSLLIARRLLGYFGKGELGGARIPKYLCALFLIFLWVFYVVMSSLQAYGHIETNF